MSPRVIWLIAIPVGLMSLMGSFFFQAALAQNGGVDPSTGSGGVCHVDGSGEGECFTDEDECTATAWELSCVTPGTCNLTMTMPGSSQSITSPHTIAIGLGETLDLADCPTIQHTWTTAHLGTFGHTTCSPRIDWSKQEPVGLPGSFRWQAVGDGPALPHSTYTSYGRFEFKPKFETYMQLCTPDISSNPCTLYVDVLPALDIAISPSPIDEGAGLNAAIGTVTRPAAGADIAISISLTSSDLSEATVSPTITMPAGATTATFSVHAVDDSWPDGDKVVTISASAGSYFGAETPLIVADDEGAATLSLSLAEGAIFEDGTTVATVSRDSESVEDLVITLSSSDTSEASVPSTVQIPAGQSATTFLASGVLDGYIDPDMNPTLTASASNHISAQASLTVKDIDGRPLLLSASPISIYEDDGIGASTVTIRRLVSDLSEPLSVPLVTNNTTDISIPASVTIEAGASTATFAVDAIDNAIADFDRSATIATDLPQYKDGAVMLTIMDDDDAHLCTPRGRTYDLQLVGVAVGCG